MSTQMEFIMQLYMLNLMQQQQQQQQQQLLQQQQQHHQQQMQSPTKLPDISTTTSMKRTAATTSAPTTTTTPKQTRTQKRKKSQPTNCSSSRSCSPNSNASLVHPNNYHPPTSPCFALQQLLLNNIAPPMTQLLPPATAAAAAVTNLLLTPTTPMTSMAMAATMPLDATRATLMADSNIADGMLALRDSKFSPNPNSNSNSYSNYNNSNNYNSSRNSLANNFLQSSTVTSTPTEKSPAPLVMEQDVSEVADVELEDLQQRQQQRNVDGGAGVSVAGKVEEYVEYDDEDEQPLSSLQSSGNTASTTTVGEATTSLSSTSAETNKLLMCSSVQALESTDSMESPNMPYTPVKQPADSSFNDFSHQHRITLCSKDTIISSSQTSNMIDNDDSNTTPLALTNVILTPPSSEKPSATPNSDSQLPAPVGSVQSNAALTTASSLDAFLQNEDNLKHLKKVSSYLECENALCRQENLREHFHCFDVPCQGKILSKKDDIIRHLKWHKKRKESLLLGFARFSSSDDCEPAYGPDCAYNWKQTHYHCVYEECPKVYVSTSDVQMHANFHRKNSEIVQEGFRRFRAHENCKIEDCPFYGKKISHYHCCREGCQHTFKNKADMDKHKSYHLKDFQLTQDGFKKILKTETCPFDDCKYSSVCNHIHCVRENCNYILHSSSQMISHKRKHDRLDGERAYQNYKKQKDSSEEESPQPVPCSTNASTPLSSLSADHFLARKRGRPPKKIQMPAESKDVKRIKLEMDKEQSAALPSASTNNVLSNIYPQFLPNFNPAVAAAAVSAQSMQPTDSTAPNFQLTHLMALFQLQNPLFYQNLYPGGMANMLGAAAAAAAAASTNSNMNQNPVPANLSAFGGNPTTSNIKTELNEKQQFKE